MRVLTVVTLVLVALAFSVPAFAGSKAGGPTYDKPASQNGPRGQSNIGTYWLVEKDEDWNIVPRNYGGPFGKIRYNLSGETLSLDIAAHRLDSNDVYQIDVELEGTLIYTIAAGVPTDENGNLRILLTLDGLSEAPEANVPDYLADDPIPFEEHCGETGSLKVWIKDDDLPALPEWDPDTGEPLNYIYRLWEFLPLEFTVTCD